MGILSGLGRFLPASLAAAPALRSSLATFTRHKSGSHTPKGNFSPKRGKNTFYKGNADKKYGKTDSKGNWVQTKLPDYHMPDLTGFLLKPYVAWGAGPGPVRINRRFDPISPELLGLLKFKPLKESSVGGARDICVGLRFQL